MNCLSKSQEMLKTHDYQTMTASSYDCSSAEKLRNDFLARQNEPIKVSTFEF